MNFFLLGIFFFSWNFQSKVGERVECRKQKQITDALYTMHITYLKSVQQHVTYVTFNSLCQMICVKWSDDERLLPSLFQIQTNFNQLALRSLLLLSGAINMFALFSLRCLLTFSNCSLTHESFNRRYARINNGWIWIHRNSLILFSFYYILTLYQRNVNQRIRIRLSFLFIYLFNQNHPVKFCPKIEINWRMWMNLRIGKIPISFVEENKIKFKQRILRNRYQ